MEKKKSLNIDNFSKGCPIRIAFFTDKKLKLSLSLFFYYLIIKRKMQEKKTAYKVVFLLFIKSDWALS